MKKIAFITLLICLSIVSCSPAKPASKAALLEGTWELKYLTGPKIAFDGLYPNKKPTLSFDLKENKLSGNNGCNQYFGALLVDGAKINFKDAKIGMTMMACDGNGDSVYMDMLPKIETYTITDDGRTLNLLLGNIVMMRFSRQ
jgi:heat shock protein HslJ